MIDRYCRGVHNRSGAACAECGELLAYASKRLDHCPYGEEKPACAKCPIHCYHPSRREQVKAVMRYSGPRMMLRHPYLAVRHWIDGLKKVPPQPRRARGSERGPAASENDHASDERPSPTMIERNGSPIMMRSRGMAPWR